MTRRGPRPAGADTRDLILESARIEFSESGYDAVSVRAVARRAGVDPALVHHYFKGKAGLFAATMEVPVDPEVIIAAILAGPVETIGERMAASFLTIWDSPEGRPRFQALARSAMSHDEAARVLREFLTREVFGRIIAEVSHPGDRTLTRAERTRAGLAASQLFGLAISRYVLDVPGVVDATPEDLLPVLGPTLQRYVVG